MMNLALLVVLAGTTQGVDDDRAALARLPAARVSVEGSGKSLVIELPPVDLPGRPPGGDEPMVMPPVARVEIPINGYITGYRVEVRDSAGRPLAQSLLHHFNLNDPDHRELFLPISLHILAASRETPALTIPWLLFGVPLARGQRFLSYAMLANTGPAEHHGVRVRLVLRISPARRPWPLHRAYPWVMDVLFPVGHPPGGSKAFDLPPGRTARSWESTPAISGTILGMGGHLHDYGVSLELSDVTTGRVLAQLVPERDAAGLVRVLPPARLYRWYRLGVHIESTHRYRVTVTYDNPTGQTIPDGGMGAVAGLFVPDAGKTWPGVDTTDAAYRQDLHDSFWELPMDMMKMTHSHSH